LHAKNRDTKLIVVQQFSDTTYHLATIHALQTTHRAKDSVGQNLKNFMKNREPWLYSLRCCCYENGYLLKVKGPNIALNEQTHLRATERHLSYGITQCYLPPDRGERAPP